MGFTADQAEPLLAELEKFYPRYREEFRLSRIPERAVGEVRKAARDRYDLAIKAGRDVVLRHLKEVSAEGQETPESWRRLLPWLSAPQELKAWRVLASVLARLHDPAAGDPVTSLENFLRQERFELKVHRLYLEVPDGHRLQPSGNLILYRQSGNDARSPLAFELLSDPQQDSANHQTRYTFRPLGDSTLAYSAGETLWVEVPVRVAGSTDHVLTWSRNRSQSYQFERLVQPARLHRKDQLSTQGEVAEGVRLLVSPDDGVPHVPDLLPDVPLKLGRP
jgi:hypothetical protein